MVVVAGACTTFAVVGACVIAFAAAAGYATTFAAAAGISTTFVVAPVCALSFAVGGPCVTAFAVAEVALDPPLWAGASRLAICICNIAFAAAGFVALARPVALDGALAFVIAFVFAFGGDRTTDWLWLAFQEALLPQAYLAPSPLVAIERLSLPSFWLDAAFEDREIGCRDRVLLLLTSSKTRRA